MVNAADDEKPQTITTSTQNTKRFMPYYLTGISSENVEMFQSQQ
jgi:hypothetical protein